MSSSPTVLKQICAGKPRGLALLLCLLLVATILPHASQAMLQSPGTPEASLKNSPAKFVPGEILVRFRTEAAPVKNETSTALALRAPDHEIPLQIERFDGSDIVDGLRLARVRPEDTLPAIEALNARADVLYAEPNYIRRKDAIPNDPRFAEMWALKNTGQSGGKVGADIRAEEAWNTTTGSRNVVVGIVDEGIDINHPDLRDNIWRNPGEVPGNRVDDDGNGFVDDVNGYDFFHNDASVFDARGIFPSDDTDSHGTHVAGTIGAVGNNGEGVVGVNWQVSLMSLKILGSENENPAPSSVLLSVKAYDYAKMMRDLWESSGGTRGANIRVLNNSYGDTGKSRAELDAIRALGQSGILFVASAGNDRTNNDRFPHYPSGYDASNIISVAATDRYDTLTSFSNYGSRSVSMAAPGASILGTTPRGTYSYFSGTSMASPHVAGAAALVCAANPNLSVERLRGALLYSGDELSSIAPGTYSGVLSGRRLNALAALQNIAESDTTAPAAVRNLRIVSQSGQSVNLQWIAPGDDDNSGRASVYEIRFADNDPRDVAQFDLARVLVAPKPAAAGTTQTATVTIPFRHPAGFIGVRAVDNVGNASAIAAVNVTIDPTVADPYLISQSGPGGLSTGGTALNLIGDDKTTSIPYQLPFDFTFFGMRGRGLNISTNGVLYLTADVPRLPNGDSDDAKSSVDGLNSLRMIAGLWDDLRTDRRPGDDVYVVIPDPNRIIFRWQAVTYDTPIGPGATRGEHPVNFEIELRQDGTIQVRYGAGNHNVFPVVGISGGEPDTYIIASHTSESALKDLTNAAAVTFTPRNPTPPPSADLYVHFFSPTDFVVPGQQITYNIGVGNSGPDTPSDVMVTIPIPSGTSFVSCDWCANQSPGPGVPIIARPQNFGPHTGTTITLVLKVTAAPGSTISSTATVSSSLRDPNPANNSVTSTPIGVLQELVVATPVFSPEGGNFSSAVNVTISCATTNAFIRYTTNGNDPTESDLWIPSGFYVRVDRNQTLKAKAWRTGWNPSSVKSGTYTIGTPNPIDDARTFVRQQYLDFLGREPDQGGWDYWTNEINKCGADAVCVHKRRIGVSAAFFYEAEFQRTGGYVYRVYKSTLGRQPAYAEFMQDRPRVVEGPTLDATKTAYAEAFVQRAEFLQKYPAAMTADEFMGALLRSVKQASGVDLESQRDSLKAMYQGGAGRAAIVRTVADDAGLAQAEKNASFVRMEYFGYLRRDPDAEGEAFWLNILNNKEVNNYRGMVCAFLTSREYQQRFGSSVTRSNQDCAQLP